MREGELSDKERQRRFETGSLTEGRDYVAAGTTANPGAPVEGPQPWSAITGIGGNHLPNHSAFLNDPERVAASRAAYIRGQVEQALTPLGLSADAIEAAVQAALAADV